MKKTQDQRFLEYAGIITSGKLQERGKHEMHTYVVLKAFMIQVEVLLACRVCVCVCKYNGIVLHEQQSLLCCGQQHKQTDEAVLQSAEVLWREGTIKVRPSQTQN